MREGVTVFVDLRYTLNRQVQVSVNIVSAATVSKLDIYL